MLFSCRNQKKEESVVESIEPARLQMLRDALVTMLSIQDWEIIYEKRKSIASPDGDEALGCIIIYPASLMAYILTREGLGPKEEMEVEIHEHVHLTQNEIIALMQSIHKYAPEPQAGNIADRLHEAIEPACVRVTRFVCRALGEVFPELDDLQKEASVRTVEEEGESLSSDFICVVQGGRVSPDEVLKQVRGRGARKTVIV